MEITLLQIYALKQNALSDGIQPVSKWGWCGESQCAAPASCSTGSSGGVLSLGSGGGCEPPKCGVPLQFHTDKWCDGWWWSLSAPKEEQGFIWACRSLGALGALGSWFQSVLLSAAASRTNNCPRCLSAPSTVSSATGNSPSRCNGWCVGITFKDSLIKAKCKWYLLCIHAFSEIMFVWPEVFLTFLSPSIYSLTLYGSVKELLAILNLLSYFELRYLVSSVIQDCLMIHCSASPGIMHQILVGSFAGPLFWFGICFHPHGCSQQAQQNRMFFSGSFMHWKDCAGSGAGEDGMFLKWRCTCRQGLFEGLWAEINCAHLQGSSPNTWLGLFCICATALPLFPACFDSSAVSPPFPATIHVPSFYWFLCICTPSQPGVSLMSFGGAAGSRQVGILPACLYPQHAEELLYIRWSRRSLLRFVCFGDIFSAKWEPTAEINATWSNLGTTSPSVKLTQSSSHHSSILARGE